MPEDNCQHKLPELEGNNVVIPPGVNVGYNSDWGFDDGAQNGIFEDGPVSQNSTLGTTTGAQDVTPDEVSGPKNTTLDVASQPKNTTLDEMPRTHNGTYKEGCKVPPSSA